MPEQIYGILYGHELRQPGFSLRQLDCLISQPVTGLFVLDSVVDEKQIALGTWCLDNGLDLILGFSDRPEKPYLPRLHLARSITPRLAVGNTRLGEWVGNAAKVARYRRMGDRFGFEWVSTITHKTVLVDLQRGGGIRRAMGQTLCLCLCGYVLAGYLFDEPRMPDLLNTTLAGRNLHEEFGVTIENLQNYLAPMNTLSGAGWQRGLDVGSRVYTRTLGFKGMVIGLPFHLEGTDQLPIKSKPLNYPLRCGS